MVIQLNSSVIWQKGKSQNGGNKNTKHVKFSNFPKNERFLPPDTHTYVCVSGGKKTFVFRKIWRALYSCYLRFEIRPFAIVPTNLEKAVFKLMQSLTSKLQFNVFTFSGKAFSDCLRYRNHHPLYSALWRFYLFRLIFLVNLSQGRHAPSFCACLVLRRLFLRESSWTVHGTRCSLVCSVVPDDVQLSFMLSCWGSRFNAICQTFFFFFFFLYIYRER